jgi:predicted peptidase
MKKKTLFPLAISALLMLGAVGCKTETTPTEDPQGQTEVEDKSQVIQASLEKNILEIDEKTKVVCNLPGVTYRSSDEDIVTVDATGKVKAIEMGNAFITVSKPGHFDKVLKVFVDEYETVDYLVEGFEYGPAIVGVKVNLSGKVKKTDLGNATFSVKTNGSNRTVERVDLCDAEGEITDAAESHYIRISLVTQSNSWGPTGGASCFTYANNVNDWTKNIRVEVSLASGTLVAGDETYNDSHKLSLNTIRSRIVLSTREWGEAKSHTANNYTLTYKGYEPDKLREDGVKNPLVIWLHGMGEGGTDIDIALLGNDVTALGEIKIQDHFVEGQQKGAYVLAVQTPTYWMNSGTGSINNGVGHSIYTQTLKATIDKFIAENGDIDTKRVFIGGCSNGGYMTMEMAVTYGDFFRAYYPCCEAYSDSFVTDADINKLKDLPMWFIHAANDTTVDATNFVIPTYQRLVEAGAKDLHFSYFTNVTGTEGNPNGNDYMGHYSWIYIFRDEVKYDQADPLNISAPSTKEVKDANGITLNLFSWMAAMK